jgi:hypothetical protein
MILSPHFDEQSLSFLSVQLPGQQPSPGMQTICSKTHSAWHPELLSARGLQGASSGHSVGQAPATPFGMPMSHFSSPVTRPSPQCTSIGIDDVGNLLPSISSPLSGVPASTASDPLEPSRLEPEPADGLVPTP